MKIRRSMKYVRKRIMECMDKVSALLDECDTEYETTYMNALHTELVGASDMLDCLRTPEYFGNGKFVDIEQVDTRNLHEGWQPK